MRYIKLFESFNDFSNIKQDIKDIFVELIDERFRIRFRPNYGFSKHDGAPDERDNDVFIKHFKEGNFSIILERERDDTMINFDRNRQEVFYKNYDFQISEVYEYIMMLIDFVESVGIDSEVHFHATTRNKKGSNYIKKMNLTQLEKFMKEGKPINFLEIIFESN
jgi:hypothetical protein